MEKRIAAFSGACLLPRCARILKPGTYGSPRPLPSHDQESSSIFAVRMLRWMSVSQHPRPASTNRFACTGGCRRPGEALPRRGLGAARAYAVGGGVGGSPSSMWSQRFSSIRRIGQNVTEPPKSRTPAEKTRAPEGVS